MTDPIEAGGHNKEERFKALSGRSIGIEDLSETEIAALTATRMAPEHDHLNSLLKDMSSQVYSDRDCLESRSPNSSLMLD